MVHIYKILNVSAFQICLCRFCVIILSKVNSNFVNLGKICGFEVFENRNMLLSRAALEVFGTMNEVFAIDTSPKMNDFARLLLQGGNEQGRLPPGYFFRLHLPRDSQVTSLF